jgi:hypothetical protein
MKFPNSCGAQCTRTDPELQWDTFRLDLEDQLYSSGHAIKHIALVRAATQSVVGCRYA